MTGSLRGFGGHSAGVRDSLTIVAGYLLPQAREFKYLGVFFRSDGKMKWEMNKQFGAESAPDCFY